MSMQELQAANKLAVLIVEHGLTPATYAGLVQDFITLKGLNGELYTYVQGRLEDCSAGEA